MTAPSDGVRETSHGRMNGCLYCVCVCVHMSTSLLLARHLPGPHDFQVALTVGNIDFQRVRKLAYHLLTGSSSSGDMMARLQSSCQVGVKVVLWNAVTVRTRLTSSGSLDLDSQDIESLLWKEDDAAADGGAQAWVHSIIQKTSFERRKTQGDAWEMAFATRFELRIPAKFVR